MKNKRLSLDEIIKETDGIVAKFERENALWWIDKRWPQFKIYKFDLETEIAERVIGVMFEELQESSIYGIIESKWRDSDRYAPLKIGFRRLPIRNRNLQQKVRYLFGGSFLGFGYYGDLNHFATAYIVDSSSEEAMSIRNDGIEYPKSDKSVLIIGVQDRDDCKLPFLDLMRTFYSAYQKLKTPSETLQVH